MVFTHLTASLAYGRYRLETPAYLKLDEKGFKAVTPQDGLGFDR
jgi:hypothetical protein